MEFNVAAGIFHPFATMCGTVGHRPIKHQTPTVLMDQAFPTFKIK